VAPSPARTATIVAVPVALLSGVLAFWVLGGFGSHPHPAAPPPPRPQSTGPVTVSAPALTGEPAAACRALVDKLPATLNALPRRPVTTGAEQNTAEQNTAAQNTAAYGDPAVILACGAPPVPPDVTDQTFELAGVCWYPQKRPGATVWTTMDRRVPVAVTVPNAYDPPSKWVIDFSAPVLATIPPAPTRCR
jgi:hypothetical protein